MTDIMSNLCLFPPHPVHSQTTPSLGHKISQELLKSLSSIFFKIQTELPTVYNGNSGYGYSMITATTNPSRLKAAAAVGLLFTGSGN